MRRLGIRCRVGVIRLTIVGAPLLLAAAAPAQSNCGQYGVQCRADQTSQLIVLGVQQAASALPPASGQSFLYEFDPSIGAFKASEQLGPTVFRTAETIGERKLDLRTAVSFFELSDTFGPVTYETDDLFENQTFPLYTQFGTVAKADVWLMSFAATYGVTDRIEVTLNVPISVVSARGAETYLTGPQFLGDPPSQRQIGFAGSEADLDGFIADGTFVRATSNYDSLGAAFNSGTHAGVGRISVGAKGLIWSNDVASVGAQAEFFCPSPSQDQFAGSDTPAILPRAIGAVRAAKYLNLYADAGYDYDFDTSKLQRFAWTAGLSVPFVNGTFDVGVSGSQFASAIRWTPLTTSALDASGREFNLSVVPQQAGDTKLGTTYVDFISGLRIQLAQGVTASGAIGVPVTEDGFRPTVLATAALEFYF